MDTCPQIADLGSLVSGDLSPEAAARIGSHLAGCERCRNAVAAYRRDRELAADIHVAFDETTIVREMQEIGVTIERPDRVGPYRILDVLGEGGMGTVYLAEQTEPIQRRVALKLIKLGMDTREVIARFESERQALALMDHPHVARVLDAGATDLGRPYFVMEHVPGEPITTYCDRHHLSIPDRLNLFMQVCDAIQHAHQKGVIHRDIKPSNVLVMYQNGKPVPKVIDFGVAKATNQRLTEKTVFTEHGQLIGTPAYMSPEQAEMTTLDIDTRTDVYSLGVLLYELLTGALPFDPKSLRSAGYAAIQRIIREIEPSKPSTKLGNMLADDLESGTQAAERTKLDLLSLCRHLRGDLDWITMKALEKERSRRYGSASDLASDIRRYLDNEPVTASPPSAGYRVRKFVRRNRTGVIFAGVVVGILVLGVVGSLTGWLSALRARDAERLAAKQAKESAKLAEQQATILRKKLYNKSIALAARKYESYDIGSVKALLEECPVDLRAWEWYRLQSVSDQSTLTLQDHTGSVRSVACSSDRTRIVSSSSDHSLAIWNARDGKTIHTIRGHTTGVRAVSFSPDDQIVVSAGLDGAIRLWDSDSGQEIRTLREHGDPLRCVSFSPDGRYVVSGDNKGAIELWDVGTGGRIVEFQGHRGSVLSVSFSPDGERIASGSFDRTLRIWRTATGDEVYSIRTHQRGVESVSFNPEGNMVASAGRDGTVTLWNSSTGDEVVSLHGHNGGVKAVSFNPGGDLLVSGGIDNTIRLWDTQAKKEVACLRGHTGPVNSVDFSSDGEWIVSGGDDKSLKIWSAGMREDHRVLRRSNRKVWAVAFNPDGTQIVSANDDNSLGLIATTTGSLMKTIQEQIEVTSSIAYSPNGHQIVSASGDDLTMWDVETGEPICELDAHSTQVWAVAYSPDGELIASGSGDIAGEGRDCTLRIWDAETCEELHICRGHTERVTSVAASPNGKRIVTGSWDDTIRIWDVASGEQLMVLIADADGVNSVAYSPNGRQILSGGSDGRLRLWDAETGESMLDLIGHTSWVSAGVFSPDGRRVVSGSGDRTLRIWDVGTGDELLTLRGHSDQVNSVAFSPDGESIISGSSDGSLRMWGTERPCRMTESAEAHSASERSEIGPGLVGRQ